MKHCSQKLIVGAVVGGLISGVAALLLTPKSGKCIRKGICDTCNNVADGSRRLSDCVCCHTDSFAKKIKSLLGAEEEPKEEGTADLFVGAAVGSVVGILAGVLVAKKPGAEFREEIADAYSAFSDKTHKTAHDLKKQSEAFVKSAKKKTNKWLEFARENISELSEDAKEVEEEFLDRAQDQINNVIEWANVGLKLWRKLRK